MSEFEYRNIEDIKEDIMAITNGGLDIFMELYPHANTNKNFKLRQERTASASLHKNKSDGNWILTDFGSGEKPMNAITAYAAEHNLEWVVACLQIANNLNIPTGTNVPEPMPDFKEYSIADNPYELDDDGYHFELTTEFTQKELKLLGPYVTAETCKHCNCFKVISIASVVKDKRTGAMKVLERFSNDNYPIYAFVNEHNGVKFKKIYQPKSKDKKYKFMYVGGRPTNFVNGLDRVVKHYGSQYDSWLERKQRAESNQENFNEKEPDKIDQVIICSGERDALNMTSLGYFCVWHNSETASWEKQYISKIYKNAEKIINIPDIDETGVAQGKALAEKFLMIHTLWLPKFLLKRKDARMNPCKDLTDYFKTQRHKERHELVRDIKNKIERALPLQFWDSVVTDKGSVKWSFSNTLLNNFLRHYGYYKHDLPGSKNGWIFIKITGHLVERVEVSDILGFIDAFLEKRNLPIELRDLAITSTNLNEQKLARIKKAELNFKNFGKYYQTFSFSHQNWLVSKNGIEATSSLNSNYVWSSDVIDKKISESRDLQINPEKDIKILPPFFKINEENGNYDIDILNNKCDFLNFLINTSRVYWKDEYILPFDQAGKTVEEIYATPENIAYRKANKFNIQGPRLTKDQIKEQKLHLINKIYTIGYLLHAYKDEATALLVYLMENDVMDDSISNGGSGKSIITKSFSELVEMISRPGTNKEIFKDKFVYDGVTEHTRVFVFDDADKYMDMRDLYSQISGDLYVNPKNGTAYTISFKHSPKFAITSNFAPRVMDGSTKRRLLISATSNYYHTAEEGVLPGRIPPQDFGGKRFFQDWDAEQYNLFINFYLQCLVFYLNTDKIVKPPMNNISKRNLLAQIGKHFMDFADEFFAKNPPDDKGMVEYSKSLFKEEVQNYHKQISGMSSTAISNSLEAYCKLHGYEYMPGRDRYQKSENGRTVDYILINVGKQKEPENKIDYTEI